MRPPRIRGLLNKMISKEILSGTTSKRKKSRKIIFGENKLLQKVIDLRYVNNADADKVTGAIIDSSNFPDLQALWSKPSALRQRVHDTARSLNLTPAAGILDESEPVAAASPNTAARKSPNTAARKVPWGSSREHGKTLTNKERPPASASPPIRRGRHASTKKRSSEPLLRQEDVARGPSTANAFDSPNDMSRKLSKRQMRATARKVCTNDKHTHPKITHNDDLTPFLCRCPLSHSQHPFCMNRIGTSLQPKRRHP